MAEAVKLSDKFDSAGRRLTAVDELINETIAGDAKLAERSRLAEVGNAAAWEAVARDLARQVINAETEIAELDAVIEDREDDETNPDAEWQTQYWDLAGQRDTLADELDAEEQAHCDTYIEAVRLSAELAGWQNSSHAEYRRSTAARRLENYRKPPLTATNHTPTRLPGACPFEAAPGTGP